MIGLLGWLGCVRDPSGVDRDGDGYAASVDCDDRDPERHPEAADPPGDGEDRDCDGGDGSSEWLGAVDAVVASEAPWMHLGVGLAAHGDRVAVSGLASDRELDGGDGEVWLLAGPGLDRRREWRGSRDAALGSALAFDGRGALAVGEVGRVYVWDEDLPSGEVPSAEGGWFGTLGLLELGTLPVAFADLSGGPEPELALSGWVTAGGGDLEPRIRLCASPSSGALGPADTVLTGWTGAPTTADVDGDGHADLVLGAEADADQAGRVTVVHGPFPAGELDDVAPLASWSGDAPGDWLGQEVASGDLDGDGADELVVAAAGWPGGERRGVVVGLSAGTPTLGDARFRLEADDGVQLLGVALVVADLDGDGAQDLAVGAPGLRASDPGRVLVFHGPLSGRLVASDADRSFAGVGPGDRAGARLAVADLDGDGSPDLLITSPDSDLGAEDGGAVHAVLGPLRR
jgi:hypothetical protein